ncbi:MAG TPA: thiolase family protein [Nitrososphaera sp.]|nr:thiolase family protein [Nitrososphaera sp.]
MRRVAISSWATSKFSKDSKVPLLELACEPCADMLKSGISRNEIDAVLFSSCATEQYSSTIISEMLGIRPKVSHRIDSLCNSGTNAVASAFSMIASGLCDMALVVGAEKANSPGNRLLWDITRGSFMFPVHWAAIFAKAHMRKYGTTEAQMAKVSVKNHKNAAKNPLALFRKQVSLNEVMNSKKIADPVKLLDCSAPCDGASAVLLVSEEKAKKMDKPVWIKGIGQQTNSASFAKAAGDLTAIEAARRAARVAFEMSQTKPLQVEVAELHDAFTILEILAYEDLGFVKKGEGGKFVDQQEIAINPRGGIIGCGHPVGTTGVAQVAEVASQLAGKAGKRQVKGCRTGLVHNLAAAGSSATIIIMGA